MAKKEFTFQVQRQEGFVLNPNDKVVNGVIKGLKRNEGKCPCYHGDDIADEDLICPCKEYRENKHCRCNLYVTEEPKEDLQAELAKYKEAYEKLKIEASASKVRNKSKELVY